MFGLMFTYRTIHDLWTVFNMDTAITRTRLFKFFRINGVQHPRNEMIGKS